MIRWLTAVALLLVAGPAWALNNSFPASGDTVMCSGRPWLDALCESGVDPTDTTDSTAGLQAGINAAIAAGVPFHIPAGKYKVTSLLTVDYQSLSSTGFQLISEGATLDGRSIASGGVLQVTCSGGTAQNPKACFYFHQRGTLFILANSGQTNLATLTAAYSSGATVLSVSSTAPFYAGQTIIIALASGGTFATPVASVGTGTITIATPLPGATNLNAQVSQPSYPFAFGKTDFSDQHNSIKLDHLQVNNASTAPGAGGCQFNAIYDSDIFAVCDSAGGAAGIAIEQVQFSRVAGAGSAAGTGGAALALENGYTFSNWFFALDLEVAPTCLSITNQHHGNNTFISPYFNCTTAVNATGSDNNLLVNPQYAGAVVNFGPQSTGISVIGTGSRAKWMFPAAASYAAAPIDDTLALSSYNAPGSSMTVTLPAAATLNAGWSMSFATDNGKGMTVNVAGGDVARIVAGSKNVSSLALGAGIYEHVTLQFDGSNFRVLEATRNTRLANGFDAAPWPANWLYPSASGYAAQLADNGNVLSSFNTPAGLTVTLPPTTAFPPNSGWVMGFATDNGKPVTVQVNGTSGGHILYPGSGASTTSVTMAATGQGAYEFMVIAYDSVGSSGNFRILSATPATAQALGMIGSGAPSQWLFPAASAYAAGVGDGGRIISSQASPLGYMTVTLPPTTALPAGWTIGIVQDGGKATSVQVNGTSGGHILYPNGSTTATSLSLAQADQEMAILQYDGAGAFRVLHVTPATAQQLGMGGPGAISRWVFPAVAAYTAAVGDNGKAISSFNAPGAGMTVTLPAIAGLPQGWTLGLATDGGKTMTVQVNGGAGEKILSPGTRGAVASLALSSAFAGYEMMTVQFDGSNWRVVGVTPATANNNGMMMPQGTPASSSAACQTGQLEYDSNYLYICTNLNTWKRAAWSSF